MPLEWSLETQGMIAEAALLRDRLRDLEGKILHEMKKEEPLKFGDIIQNKKGEYGMVVTFGYSPRYSSPQSIVPTIRKQKKDGSFGLRTGLFFYGWEKVSPEDFRSKP